MAKILRRSGAVDSPAEARDWCDLHKLSYDTIQRILTGESKNVEFNTADRIMCALDCNEIWYGELKKWYWPPGEEPPKTFREACKAMTKIAKVLQKQREE